jgi:aldehyde:ferredoxin oxidoreductase
MTVYAGRYLQVDLSLGDWSDLYLDEADVRTWLLGSGMAARLYYDQMSPSLDPLAPASPLLVFNGLLTGTFAPTGCRTSWCGRSPLTGIWNEANVGNYWGAELRRCNYDGLLITGRSAHPVFLWIDGTRDRIELRDASHLWGQDYFRTAELLAQETDPRAQIAGIGQAGERLVRIAGVLNGPADLVRTAGRGGMGALMGSKHLKAIVLRGNAKPSYPDPERFRQVIRTQNADIKQASIGMSAYGTSGGVVATEIKGDMALRNWTLGNWPEVTKISGQTIHQSIKVKHTHCFACPIGCGHQEEVQEGEFRSPRGKGLEYETIAGFGGSCQVSDLGALSLANSLCNRYGLDTISTSNAIAFAMEAFEKGLISDADTGGVMLRFGDAAAMVAMVHKIALREDIGTLLGEGVRTAAIAIGNGAEDLAVHVKGMEVAYHDPRAFVSMAVNYATAVRGGCHLEALSYWNGYGLNLPDLGYGDTVPYHASGEAQARMAYDWQNYTGVFNPLGLCKFIIKAQVGPERLVEIVNNALGWEWTPDDVLTAGDRLFQLKRLINLRLGVTAADDTLPPRLLTEPRPTGEAAGVLPNLAAMLPIYYRLRGWDEHGRPGTERLRQLGIDATA